MWVLLLSFIAALIYLIIGITKKKITSNSLVDIFSVVFSMASILSGAKLVIITVSKNGLFDELSDLDLIAYTVFGGLAVIWLAVWELYKKFKDLY